MRRLVNIFSHLFRDDQERYNVHLNGHQIAPLQRQEQSVKDTFYHVKISTNY